MKLRRTQREVSDNSGETSLILFCANYKKDKLEKVRRKNKNCLKCVRRVISKSRTQSSTPVIKTRSESRQSSSVIDPELFFNSLSPITQRHNTLERIKRENMVRRNLLEKSLQAIIAEAKKELEHETTSTASISSSDYMSMNANNNSKLVKNNNDTEDAEDYVEDEVYEEILFQQKTSENFYEPVDFNIYEPINF